MAESVAGVAGYEAVTLGHELSVTRFPLDPEATDRLLQTRIMLALL